MHLYIYIYIYIYICMLQDLHATAELAVRRAGVDQVAVDVGVRAEVVLLGQVLHVYICMYTYSTFIYIYIHTYRYIIYY